MTVLLRCGTLCFGDGGGVGRIRDRKDAVGGIFDSLLVATQLDGYSGSIYLSSSSTMIYVGMVAG